MMMTAQRDDLLTGQLVAVGFGWGAPSGDARLSDRKNDRNNFSHQTVQSLNSQTKKSESQIEKAIGSSDLAFQHPTLRFYDQKRRRRRTGDKVSRSKSLNGVRLSKSTIDKKPNTFASSQSKEREKRREGDPVYIFRVVRHTDRVSRTTTRVSLSLLLSSLLPSKRHRL